MKSYSNPNHNVAETSTTDEPSTNLYDSVMQMNPLLKIIQQLILIAGAVYLLAYLGGSIR